MHYHLEIIMPPTTDIEGAVKQILEPFNEQPEKEDEDTDTSNAFWDFFVIGGRWAGQKLLAGYDKEKLEEFERWLHEQKFTVSGLVAGKQELKPESQIPIVDAKWNEMFPFDPPMACPLFAHSNDQYGRNGRGTLPMDVITLESLPENLECSRVILACPDWKGETIKATYMLCQDQWNGVNHMPVKWDGKISTALSMFRDKHKNYSEEYINRTDPKPNWLVVTIDYHS